MRVAAETASQPVSAAATSDRSRNPSTTCLRKSSSVSIALRSCCRAAPRAMPRALKPWSVRNDAGTSSGARSRRTSLAASSNGPSNASGTGGTTGSLMGGTSRHA